jgi:arylamine N-acetyltransferase
MNFTAPAPLNANAATDSRADLARAIVVSDRHGHWVAVWESKDTLGGTIGKDSDILVARSTGNGQMWTTPAPLNTNAATDSSSDYHPVVATDGKGNWVAAWNSNDSLGGTIQKDWDILTTRSTDNGQTWTAPAPLNANAANDTGQDYVPDIATDSEGNWVAVWEAEHGNGGPLGYDFDLFVARSTDNGATWTDPTPLNTNAATDSGSDYLPCLATDRNGNWVVAWDSNDSLGGAIDWDQDILVSRSTDNGATWTAPAPLNTNAATDSGNDYYPDVATDGNDNWVTAWHSDDTLGGTIWLDEDILVSRSMDNGATWTDPTPLNTNAASDQGFDSYPIVATDGQGDWVTVWMSGDTLGGTIGTDYDVLVARSTDNGETWSAPIPLNTNATTDSGADYYPTVATDGDGHWVAAWESTDSLGGTTGHDHDILFAISPIPAGSLTLLTPNGGENWGAGTSHKIKWMSTGNPGPDVKLKLLRKGAVVKVIAASTPNDGREGWIVPADLTFRKGYEVTISSTSDAAITDMSDALFRIKAAK